jgi:ribosomal protein L37E
VDTSLDGNAAAGALGDLFAFDVTVAVSTCASCGDGRPVAELRAYLDAPGMVLRCASCGAAQLRLVRSNDRAWLDLRGIRVLEIHGTPTAE